jgi:hypothetical protein
MPLAAGIPGSVSWENPGRNPLGFAVAAAPVRSKFTAFSGYDLNGLDQTRG